MRLWILSFMLFLSTSSFGYQEPDFRYYIQKFDKIFGTDSSELDVYFENIDLGTENVILGVCYHSNSISQIKSRIVIDKDRFKEMSIISQEALLFHELGHCIMDLEHDDLMIYTSVDKTFPGSLMYHYHLEEEYLVKYYRYYLKQLMWMYKGHYRINEKHIQLPQEGI